MLCDEAYRGLNHAQYGENFAPAMADLYEKGVSVGSFSKTFSLAGLRLGWVAAPVELIERINRRRDYNTISCGKIDDYLAALAIRSREALLRRNLKIVADNAAVLDAWVNSEPRISYVRPKAGTTAFLKYDAPVDQRHLLQAPFGRDGRDAAARRGYGYGGLAAHRLLLCGKHHRPARGACPCIEVPAHLRLSRKKLSGKKNRRPASRAACAAPPPRKRDEAE